MVEKWTKLSIEGTKLKIRTRRLIFWGRNIAEKPKNSQQKYIGQFQKHEKQWSGTRRSIFKVLLFIQNIRGHKNVKSPSLSSDSPRLDTITNFRVSAQFSTRWTICKLRSETSRLYAISGSCVQIQDWPVMSRSLTCRTWGFEHQIRLDIKNIDPTCQNHTILCVVHLILYGFYMIILSITINIKTIIIILII